MRPPTSTSGTFMPDAVFANIGKLLLATQIYDMHRIAHYVSGGLIVTLPGPDEDHNPETAGDAGRGAARQPRRPVRQAHRGGALPRGPDRLLPGRLVLGHQPARRRLAGGDEAGDLAQLPGRQQGRAGRAAARTAASSTIRARAITANRQPGRCCDTGCTPPGKPVMVDLPDAARVAEATIPDAPEREALMTAAPVYADFQRRSLADRDAFWAEQARLIDWQRPVRQRLRRQPAAVHALVRRRHAPTCATTPSIATSRRTATSNALIYVSTETDEERIYTFARAACRSAAHGGLSARARRRAGRPRADLHADDSRGGLRDAGLRAHRRHPLGGVRRLRQRQPGEPDRRRRAEGRGQRRCRQPLRQGRRATSRCSTRRSAWPVIGRPRCCSSIAAWRRWSGLPGATSTTRRCANGISRREVPCTWLDSTAPSYTLYTSGTTGSPKGVQRDTGGYAVALAASMKYIFCGQPARPTSPPATSAGSSATATSSTAR